METNLLVLIDERNKIFFLFGDLKVKSAIYDCTFCEIRTEGQPCFI